MDTRDINSGYAETRERRRLSTLTRIVFSLVFLAGGLFAAYAWHFLAKYDHSRAKVPPAAYELIPRFACAYFALGAVSVCVARKRSHVWLAAVCSHLVLVITYGLLCFVNARENPTLLVPKALMLAIITVTLCSPWPAIWAFLLLIRDDKAGLVAWPSRPCCCGLRQNAYGVPIFDTFSPG